MQKKSKLKVFTFTMLIIIGLTFQPAISAYAVCPDDIFFYLKMGEAAGPDYADFIKDNDGTGSANVTATAADGGIVNRAQDFNGTDTQINVTADNSFDWQADESFSIEFWVKIDSGIPVNNEIVIGRDDAGTDLHWWVGIAGGAGTVRFVLRDTTGNGAVVTGTSDVADGAWHHVVAVRDESTDDNILYVDGVEEARANPTVNYLAGFGSATAALNIGWLNLGPSFFYFDGLIDEVALYDRALESVTEIPAHHAAGLAGEDYCDGAVPFVPFPDDTISLWQLDENPVAADAIYADAFDGNDGVGSVNPTAVPAPGGKVNGAQQFDGTGIPSTLTQINVPADNSFDWQADESFSIEFWVKIDSGIPVNNEVVIGRDDAGTDLHWWVGITGGAGTVRFVLRDTTGNGAVVTGTSDVADGAWHHVVAVRDESTDDNILYVDGVEEARANPTVNYLAGFGSATAALNIGWLNLGPSFFYFNGLIDEVALYDRALEPDIEIPAHYNAGKNGNGVQSLRPAPVADAGTDQTDIKEGTTGVTLSGSGSPSPGYVGSGSAIASYLWVQTDGTDAGTITNATTATATFTAPDVVPADTLTFQLTVTADDGQWSTDTVNVGVVDKVAPIADAGPDQPNVTVGDTVTLDGTGSDDADGTIATYLWEEVTTTGVTINNAAMAMASFTADVAVAGETLTFKLTVTDDDDLPDSATTTVTVSDSPIAPSADAGADQNVTEGDPVTLNGTGSTGTGLTFAWSPSTGSGWALSDATAESPTFTAPDVDAAGAILTFQLTVTDNLDATSSDDVNVNVADASSPLQAVAGDDQTVTVGDTVTLDSTGSTGPIASYAWEQVIIADESRVQLSNADTPTATFIAPDASASDDVAAALLETLTFQLTVTDNTGAESSDTVEVNIDDGTSTRSGGGGGGGGCFINSMF